MCWQSLTVISDGCWMARATAIRAREELAARGLIIVRRVPPLFGPSQRIYVSLADRPSTQETI